LTAGRKRWTALCSDYPGLAVTTVFLDFDGTITKSDLLDTIAQTFGDPEVYAEVDAGLDDRRLTLHEVLRREFEPVRAPLPEVVDWVLEHAEIRPGFHELVRLARERGLRLVVLSSGFRELIEPVLAREGLRDLPLYSNSVEPDPAGWRTRFRDETTCDVCGEPCKRAAVRELADGECSIYVGDGVSDRCGAEASDIVFARRGLAAYLAERGVAFEPFDDFYEVAEGIERATR
jgi:2-hydroxy-3-keto-5-methylthiopentenyl-1-phosphate phosphatase